MDINHNNPRYMLRNALLSAFNNLPERDNGGWQLRISEVSFFINYTLSLFLGENASIVFFPSDNPEKDVGSILRTKKYGGMQSTAVEIMKVLSDSAQKLLSELLLEKIEDLPRDKDWVSRYIYDEKAREEFINICEEKIFGENSPCVVDTRENMLIAICEILNRSGVRNLESQEERAEVIVETLRKNMQKINHNK